jgi:hypothetical protein
MMKIDESGVIAFPRPAPISAGNDLLIPALSVGSA